MSNLDEERSHLAQADMHILQARERIARIEALLDRSVAAGAGQEQLELVRATLDSFHAALAAFRQHRTLITQAIEELGGGAVR